MPSAVTITSIILAVITLGYLLETRKQRLLFEKIVTVDTKPKVFIKTIDTIAKGDKEKNQLVINSKILLTNCGKVEARNIVLSFVIYYGDEIKKQETAGPFQYLFPEQTVAFSLPDLRFDMKPEHMQFIEKAAEPGKILRIPKSFIEKPILLNIELDYEDIDGQQINLPFEYNYILPMNSWVFKGQHLS